MPRPASWPRENWLLAGLFAAALVYHGVSLAHNWTIGFLAGHEFRQAQTAITSYYIDQQNNFSPLYETPVLGKPWVSILMEVPFYEWAVVLLSRATGLEHVVAARAVSAACFYLTLPALYLLLGRLALPWPRRLLVLALVLTCPVYIFYSRAFLMDAMALLCCAWFLLGFVRTMDTRRAGWLGLAVVAGTGAALIKSFILAVWLLPAAGYGAALLWRDLHARSGWRAPLQTALWGIATVVVPLAALKAWIAYTDPLKEAHASAWIFSSKTLSVGNWGLFDFKALVSPDVWRQWLGCWQQAIMSPWLVGAGLVAGLAFPAVRGRALWAGACFLLPQFLFPYAYAYQDYYYYSCAVFVQGAVGLALLGALDSRLPRWVTVLLVLVPFAGQVAAYRADYAKQQAIVFDGDLPFTRVLRELTPKDSVIIVAGADWAAMTPLYAQRKALMVRNGLEFDAAYLRRAYSELAGEKVSALVLQGAVRRDGYFISLTAPRFEMDLSAPTFSTASADVYVARPFLKTVLAGLRDRARFPDVTASAPPPPELPAGAEPVPAAVARAAFGGVTPAPFQMAFPHGAGRQELGDRTVILAHSNSDLWLRPPEGATRVRWGFGIFPAAYEKANARTDGVEFIVEGELAGAPTRRLFRRVLDPWNETADRGDQQVEFVYHPRAGEVLRFCTRPYENAAFDWAYWTGIDVR